MTYFQHDEIEALPGSEVEFIFLRLTVLREYLEKELTMTNLPFEQDIEVCKAQCHCYKIFTL